MPTRTTSAPLLLNEKIRGIAIETVVSVVCFQHPTKRSEIQRIFRIARKVRKKAQPS